MQDQRMGAVHAKHDMSVAMSDYLTGKSLLPVSIAKHTQGALVALHMPWIPCSPILNSNNRIAGTVSVWVESASI